MSAYNETCAAIGNDYWNQRLFLLHGDARYIDVLERTLYNGLLSGVSLDGKSFFYPNPLESDGQHERSPWFGVACCPGNITRFLAVGARATSTRSAGDTALRQPVRRQHGRQSRWTPDDVQLTQDTRYPWDGDVRADGRAGPRRALHVRLRVPGWARNEASPATSIASRTRQPSQ